jgi:ABC-type nickel/cobalt efflux system permease component RcnA
MRRALFGIAVAAVLAALAGAPGASAHPLGNFSVNHIARVSVSSEQVGVRYILDQAVIPPFQERGLADPAVLARKLGEVRRGLVVRVDGRPVALHVTGTPRLTHPRGQGALPTTRLEVALTAPARGAHTVAVHDGTFPGRVGWKAVVAAPGAGTAVRSSVPATDPTGGLRRYPTDLLTSPSDVRTATLSVAPGAGTVQAPGGAPVSTTTTNTSGDGFAGVFERALDGRGAIVVLLLAAFAWGAIHALSPGHGKGMVAAYLVGTRGTARHAVALGATVTITHTAGVFALGLVTLALSAYVLPEDLYPWLNLVSGVLVLGVGAAVLRSRVRWARARRAGQDHTHDHTHAGHTHDHEHGAHTHTHGGHTHTHAPPERITSRSLIALGASAGLIPCPSALVVLLAAVAQHRLALGLLLIVVFSLGLAATLVGLGLAVVGVRSVGARLPVPSGAVAVLPALSTLLIVGLGLVLTVRAVPGVL